MTSSEAERRYNDWLEALDALTFAQTYTVAGHTVTRADTAFVEQQISYWGERYDLLKRIEDARGTDLEVPKTPSNVEIMTFNHGVE